MFGGTWVNGSTSPFQKIAGVGIIAVFDGVGDWQPDTITRTRSVDAVIFCPLNLRSRGAGLGCESMELFFESTIENLPLQRPQWIRDIEIDILIRLKSGQGNQEYGCNNGEPIVSLNARGCQETVSAFAPEAGFVFFSPPPVRIRVAIAPAIESRGFVFIPNGAQ
jgi:hypothetical protein